MEDYIIEFYKKFEFHKLRAAVKGLAAEGVSIHKSITKSKGIKRGELRYRKNKLGHYTRHHYLAYGMIRGLAYKQCEKHCDENNKPSAQMIVNILKTNTENSYFIEWTLEKIENWLGVK